MSKWGEKMHADYLIKNGFVIDSSQKIEEMMDVAVSSGKILKVGKNLCDIDAVETVDASGCIVSAGLIDCHMHLFEGAAWAEPGPMLSYCLPAPLPD